MRIKYSVITSILMIAILVINCKSLVRSYLTKTNFDQTIDNGKLEWKKFYWSPDTVAGKFTAKGAIYVPVRYNDVNEIFLMQLDLGAISTSFYCPIRNIPFQSKKHIDSVKSTIINASLSVGNTTSKFDKIRVRKIDYGRLNGMVKLGNLGYDYFKDKLLIIDFEDTVFAVTSKSIHATSLESLKILSNVSINKFPVLLPGKVDNKSVQFMWDTGSSTFDIMLPPKTFNALKSYNVDTLCCANAFNVKYQIYKSNTTKKINFLGNDYQTTSIYSTNKFEQDKSSVIGLKILGVCGIVGNIWFEGKTIALDFKENKVWVGEGPKLKLLQKGLGNVE